MVPSRQLRSGHPHLATGKCPRTACLHAEGRGRYPSASCPAHNSSVNSRPNGHGTTAVNSPRANPRTNKVVSRERGRVGSTPVVHRLRVVHGDPADEQIGREIRNCDAQRQLLSARQAHRSHIHTATTVHVRERGWGSLRQQPQRANSCGPAWRLVWTFTRPPTRQ
jgi:hypothetical protein